jgi:putative hydrolase of the HAD superfamily
VTYAAVIFDLFDTLVDLHYEQIPRDEFHGRSVPPTARALHTAVARHAEVDFETFLAVAFAVDEELRVARYERDLELPTVERFRAVVERLGIENGELAETMTDIHMGVLREHTTVPAHHGGILAALRSRVRVGLCSNFSHAETALRILDEADLRRQFDSIVISETLGFRKPRAEIFEAALGGLGVDAAETLHVGDSLRSDVAGAAACGIRSVWITRRVGDAARLLREFTGARPDFVVSDLSEVPLLLDRSGS